jgi:hypothetical protein
MGNAMNLSESAKMTTAHEASFRIPYANSKPRAIKVIALDPVAASLVDEVSRLPWHGAAFFTSLSFTTATTPAGTRGESLQAWLKDLAGRTMDLVTEIAASDFVVVVTAAGEDAQAASVIAEVCALHHKTLIALVVPKPGASEDDISASLRILRPYAKMLVIADGRDYIETMLRALRA